jgi:hypothetical protein
MCFVGGIKCQVVASLLYNASKPPVVVLMMLGVYVERQKDAEEYEC